MVRRRPAGGRARGLRVALLTYSTRPRGGVVHTLALAEALAALGEDVTVFTVGERVSDGFFRPVDPRVTVRVAVRRVTNPHDVDARVLASIDALAAAVRPAGFDVLHAQDCISANAVPGALRTVHHLDDFTSPVLAACHERAIVEPPAHVCVSPSVAAELEAGWGVRAEVIPNGVDAGRFAAAASPDPPAVAARARWRERLGGEPLVLTVGGIEPRKGTLDLLEAVGELRATRPGVRLAIAGGETLFDYRDYRRRFDDRARELGIRPVILGPVPDPDLPALVAAADVFALASAKEGFGLAAMEALAARRPVVLSDLPVFREVFGGAVGLGTGPVELAREILGALADPRDPAVGSRLAAAHTWRAAAEAHRALYARRAGT